MELDFYGNDYDKEISEGIIRSENLNIMGLQGAVTWKGFDKP